MKRIILSFAILLFATTAWSQGSLQHLFSWHGLSFYYPIEYNISDKEYDSNDKTYTVSCEGKDDDLSILSVNYFKVPKKGTTPQELIEDGIGALVEELNNSNSFESVKIGTITEFPISYLNSSFEYTAIVQSINVQGRAIVFSHKNYLVICLLAADSPEHYQELESILKTMTLK